jgi:hypothetical protein
MSIIDNANHNVVTYDGKNKPFTGQRLAKVTWKTNNDKNSQWFNIKRESKCVSLPVVAVADITNNIAALSPHLIAYLHGVQDKMVREMLDAGNNVVSISTDSIGIPAILEYLESSDESGRLTKESVAAWFDSTVSDNLAMVISEKLGIGTDNNVPVTDAQSAKVLEVVSAFKGKIAALAGGKTSYEPKVCKSLLNALAVAPADDALAVRFTARLNKMIEESEKMVDLMDLL